MDKQQIIQIIEKNSELNYKEIRKQAIDAGVPRNDFSDAWGASNRAYRNIKYIFAGIGLILGLAVKINFDFGLLINPISLAIVTLTPIVKIVSTSHDLTNPIVQILFILINIIVYFVIGVLIEALLNRSKHSKKFFLLLAIIVIIFILSFVGFLRIALIGT